MTRLDLRIISLVGVVALGFSLAPARPRAVDWPQWRGPARDGHTSVESPAAWPDRLDRVWSTHVGIGHSSPVVAGDVVYQFSRRGGEEGLAAIRLDDGEQSWWRAEPTPYRMNPAARDHGEGPKSTPAVADGRVFTLGISGRLSARDARAGDLLWSHDFGNRFAVRSPLYGAAMSPLVVGDRVVVHVGGPGDGALEAYAVADGRRLWSQPVDGPGYASPLLAEIDGEKQIVTQSESWVIGVAAESGELLWRLPFRTPYDQNSVSPVIWGDTLVLGGLEQGVFALRPRRAADGWQLDEVWRNREVSTYMSTPVLAAGTLYGFSHRRSGQFFALDPSDGATLWTSEGRDGENAALVALGQILLALTDDATLRAIPTDAVAFAPEATYEVAASPTWAHPVPVAGGLLVKDLEHLSRWRW